MQLDYNKAITDQYIQNCLESPPANISVFMDPKTQLALAADGKQSGSTLSDRDMLLGKLQGNCIKNT